MFFSIVLLLTFTGPICATDLANCTISRLLDVAIIFDASESMVNQHLGIIKNYVSNLVKMFNIDERDPAKGVRVSVYGFQYGPVKFCNFSTCTSKNTTLNIINQIQPMGITAVSIAGMFAFVRDHVFLQTQGARSNMANVKKIAIVILDSSVLPYNETTSNIQAGIRKNDITTFAVVIEDKGVKLSYITPFLNGPGFTVPTETDLNTFVGLRRELKARYGCSKCRPNPCKNNGTCDDAVLPPYFKCKCEAGWKGDHCELTDPCAPCKSNGGYCIVFGESTAIKCLCSPNKTGSHCQFSNLCYPLPGPCKNGASCTPNQTVANEYSCSCIGKFTGKNCNVPLTGPCAGNPCNDHSCIPITPTLHRCVCPSYCANPSNCSSCKKIEPCKPNPCLNGCQCKESPGHQGGFVCSSAVGRLGKLCGLAKAEVKCEPSYIEIRIPETVVKQYEAGISGGLVYVSPTSRNAYSCIGALDSSQKYREVKIPNPFQSCGTTKTPLGDGFEYLNTIWLNRASAVLDMPVPLLKFKCVYGSSQKIISTALKPAIGNIPTLSKSGEFEVQMKAYMRAPGSKDRGHITSGSSYTVGEMVYLTVTMMTNTSRDMVVKILNCYASATPTLERGKVDLLINGCPDKSVGVSVFNNAQQTSATIGFKTFQLLSSPTCYYCCQVNVCEKNNPACRPPMCPSTRRKRSPDDNPTPSLVHVGPFIIIEPLEQKNLTILLQEKGIPVFISGDILEKSTKGQDTGRINSSQAPYMVVATLASFIILVSLSGVVLCFLIRRKRDQVL